MPERAYVYLLSDYEEHGATNVCATMDREQLAKLLARWANPVAQGMLAVLLKETDEALAQRDGINLTHGWGGPMLHVVPLES